MRDLDAKIAAWRTRMAAGGINTFLRSSTNWRVICARMWSGRCELACAMRERLWKPRHYRDRSDLLKAEFAKIK